MRKLYEIVLVIAAAGLAATMALIEIPTHSPDLGMVAGGRGLSAGPPPVVDSSFPTLPPLLFPPGSSTPVPTKPLAAPVPSLASGVQASASAMGSFGASAAQRSPTSPTAKAPATRTKSKPPPAAKPKAAPHTSKKTKPPVRPKPEAPHTSKRSAPPPAAKGKRKPEGGS